MIRMMRLPLLLIAFVFVFMLAQPISIKAADATDQFVVIFRAKFSLSNAISQFKQEFQEASDELLLHAAATAATAVALPTPGTAVVQPQLDIIGTLGGTDTSAPAVAPLPNSGSDNRALLSQKMVQSAIVNGIVVKGLSVELCDKLKKQSTVVHTIFPDFATTAVSAVVQTSSTRLTCALPSDLRKGLSPSKPPHGSTWRGCIRAANKLVWLGERCGLWDKVSYTTVYAVSTATGEIARSGNGQICVLRVSTAKSSFSRRWFGTCGVSPTLARSLPSRVCPLARPGPPPCAVAPMGYLIASVTCGGNNYTSFTYHGVACAHNFVRWVKAVSEDGCTLMPSNDPAKVRFNHDVFGSCGVPPAMVNGLPDYWLCKRIPLPFVLVRNQVAPGETVPVNLLAIEAVKDNRVVDVASLQGNFTEEQQVVVGVFATGIDSSHPDLVYAGGQDFRSGEATPGVDGRGVGTAVGGIIGAINTGKGIVGASSGVPLFDLKVLGDDGSGFASWLLTGLNWMVQNAAAKNIKVISLALTINDDGSSAFQSARDVICTLMQALSDLGIAIVAPAGNNVRNGEDVLQVLPAACPTVLAVASVDNSGVPSSFSLWLPANATREEQATIIAAPGEEVYTTIPFAQVPAGYAPVSGTTYAAAHAAAVVANCIMSGECRSTMTGLQKIAELQEAAQLRLWMMTSGRNPWNGVDMTGQDPSHYFGLMLWSKF